MDRPVSADESPFVGRASELQRLETCLDRVLSGKGTIALISGEPGIGKSCLAGRLAAVAEDSGCSAYWGRCYEGVGAPPYWPWIEIIRGILPTVHEGQLPRTARLLASVIGTIVPEMGNLYPGIESESQGTDPDAARFHLFDSIYRFLCLIARIHPLVLILEDLHWCDETSLLLFRFISSRVNDCPILCIATYRDSDIPPALSSSLLDIGKSEGFLTEKLGELKSGDTEAFIRKALGVDISAELVVQIRDITRGNPLFIKALTDYLRSLSSSRDISAIILADIELPDRVIGALEIRFSRVSERCLDFLVIAAVVGNDIDRELMGVLEPSRFGSRLGIILDEAKVAGITVEDESTGRIRFAHSLIRGALISKVPRADICRIHGMIVAALEKLRGIRDATSVMSIAEHAIQAGDALDGDELLHYCVMAGNCALGSSAFQEARYYFESGIGVSGRDTREKAELFFGLSKALTCLGLYEQAEQTLEKSYSIYEMLSDRSGMIAVALWFVTPATKSALAEKALALVEQHSAEQVYLSIKYAYALLNSGGDRTAATASLQTALKVAVELANPTLELAVITAMIVQEVGGHYMNLIGGLRSRALELLPVVDDPLAKINAKLDCMVTIDDITESVQMAESVLEDVARLQARRESVVILPAMYAGSPFLTFRKADAPVDYLERLRFQAQNYIIGMSWQSGEWDKARKLIHQTLQAEPENIYALSTLVLIECCTGNQEAAVSWLESIARYTNRTNLLFSEVYHIAEIWEGSFDTDYYIGICKELLEDLPQKQLDYYALLILAGLAAVKGDASLARRCYGTLTADPDRMHPIDHYYFGRAAECFGDLPRAIEHFRTAYESVCTTTAWVLRARYGHDLALALIKRSYPAEFQEASDILTEGLAVAHRLGMTPLSKRIARALEDNGKKTALPAFPDDLTFREVEILGLVAKGFSNADIARMLSISGKTVANHATHIYAKTGTSNRAAAAAYAERNGLA